MEISDAARFTVDTSTPLAGGALRAALRTQDPGTRAALTSSVAWEVAYQLQLVEQYSNPRDDDGYFIWEADIMRGSAMSALNELRELAPDLITPEDMSKIIILAATSN